MRTYVTLKQHSRKGLRLPSDSTETQNAERSSAQPMVDLRTADADRGGDEAPA